MLIIGPSGRRCLAGRCKYRPPAYNTAESLYVPAPSRRGLPHLQFLLSVVLVVRFVVFCWVWLVVFWVERLVVLFV